MDEVEEEDEVENEEEGEDDDATATGTAVSADPGDVASNPDARIAPKEDELLIMPRRSALRMTASSFSLCNCSRTRANLSSNVSSGTNGEGKTDDEGDNK